MMLVATATSPLAASDPAAHALVEPVLLAVGWFEQPPLVLFALVLVTIGLFAFAHREAPRQLA